MLGESYAGTVESVGPDVVNFSPGDRIATIRPEGKIGDPRFGSFQQYALAAIESTSKLQPAVTIINLSTIAAAFTVSLGVDLSSVPKPTARKGEKVLVYGGSSSSGGLAVNCANAAGYDVVTTSSRKHEDHVASLGAAVIIDHTQPAESMLEEVKNNGPYKCILDTIGTPPVTDILAPYLSSIGGGKYSALVPLLPGSKPIPENVERIFVSYGYVFSDPKHKELRDWFYDSLLPQGLSSGVIVPTRQQWIEGGLEKVQEALDLMAAGKLSGTKLVMDPWRE